MMVMQLTRQEKNHFSENSFSDSGLNASKDDETVLNETTSSLAVSLEDVNWNEPFDFEEKDSVKDLLDDVANVNWNENVFSEIEDTLDLSQAQGDHSREFNGSYNFSERIFEVMNTKFGLESFRSGQKEIINAILQGHDCFVLMPTGGGKSLCYQLPALLSKGVTIIISPLIALICDQVDKLNSLDIRAAHLCSTLSMEESDNILSKLCLNEPLIDLLYVTPEKILTSKETVDMLDSLYKRGQVARFVIDEVHCLSLWGHDFRPHYKQLSVLREKYNDIQIICFTATATRQVETDVIINLRLRDVKKFIQSFNRPNIKYQVIDKVEKIPIFEVAHLIKQKFYRKSGIIYCLTRKDCVYLSCFLKTMGIAAKPYHAGLENIVREKTQREWMQDRFHVIVATTAFGMGIDKPDVRFVIHNTIPKSLEAFYQESGRAGRDGEVSYSYLFYNYHDVIRTMKLMGGDCTVSNTLDGHFDNLEQMVAFANNQVDCRRYLQLLNLGEDFDRQICIQNHRTTCDNCENFINATLNVVDVTAQAKELSILVRDITAKSYETLNMISKVYKGSREKIIVKKGLANHNFFGRGRRMSKLDIHRILRDLIINKVLANHYKMTGEFPIAYIKPGAELQTFLDSTDINMTIPIDNRRSVQQERHEAEHSTLSSISTDQSLSAEQAHQLTNGIKSRCHKELIHLCQKLAREQNISVSSILHPSAIKKISETLPKNQEELLKIEHVTAAIYSKFGEQILTVTHCFIEEVRFIQVSNGELLNSSTSFVKSSETHKRSFTEAFLSNDECA